MSIIIIIIIILHQYKDTKMQYHRNTLTYRIYQPQETYRQSMPGRKPFIWVRSSDFDCEPHQTI